MLGAVPEMEVSHLLDILVGDVRNIDLLSVYLLRKKVLIGLPPVPGFVDFLGWHEEEEGVWDDGWLCVVW